MGRELITWAKQLWQRDLSYDTRARSEPDVKLKSPARCAQAPGTNPFNQGFRNYFGNFHIITTSIHLILRVLMNTYLYCRHSEICQKPATETKLW